MLSEQYLELGLTGLGRCSHAIWDSHFPAAVLAGFYFTAKNKLPAETEEKIEMQLNLLIASKRQLFEPYPDGETIADSAGLIVEALEASIDKFSELGHNSIFTAYALRALHDLGGDGRARAVRDIAAGIRQFASGPARYWLRIGQGHDPRKFSLKERVIFTENLPSDRVAWTILAELPKFRNVYTQMGSKSHIGHLLTQSQSLLTLRELGFPQLANRGFYSLECRFTLLKDSQEYTASPVSFYKPATRSSFLPGEPDYWTQDFTKCEWDEGHSFKYTFSFYELMNLVTQEKLKAAATEKFRYLISPNERSTST
jgi:hypothetical protein